MFTGVHSHGCPFCYSSISSEPVSFWGHFLHLNQALAALISVFRIDLRFLFVHNVVIFLFKVHFHCVWDYWLAFILLVF